MDIAKVKEIVISLLPNEEYSLYDASFVKESGETILRVLVDKKGGINIGELADINEALSLKLDEIDGDMGEYLLEVSSPGAEKELRNLAEIKAAINDYIHLETPAGIFEGHLLEVNDDNLVIRVNLKGRFKNFIIKLADIKFIRLAVKI